MDSAPEYRKNMDEGSVYMPTRIRDSCRPTAHPRAMCLAIPARVLSIDGARAILDIRGREVLADASLVTVSPGDYVLVSAGLIVQRMEPEEAEERLQLLSSMDSVPRSL